MFTPAFCTRFFDEYESLDRRESLHNGTDKPAVEWAGIWVFTLDRGHFIVEFRDSIVADLTPSMIPLVRDVDRLERVFYR